MRARTIIAIVAAVASACTAAPVPGPTNTTAAAPAAIDIPPAADQPISEREKISRPALLDLDAIVERGYVRILVAPSRTHFETVDGRHHGRAVDAGVALAALLSRRSARDVAAVFIATRDDQLVPGVLAGRGDIAANVLLTFTRDEQVAFAPPIKTGIRELVVTGVDAPLVSLEDVGGRTVHVRKGSDHHTSLIRLNEQLKKISRPPARIVGDDTVTTDEDLLDRVNSGRIPAAIVDDYVFDAWKKAFPKIAANRDIAVSQDGILAWVTRKDAPKLTAFVKDFFSTHHLAF